MEQSLVLIKPDGVQRSKVGEILTRFERKGLKIEALKMIWLDEDLAREHYSEHKGKDFFPGLIDYITEAPLVALVVSGEQVIGVIRKMMGATDPIEADPGTIRGDLASDLEQGNLLHASDSKESAEREIELFFAAEEIYSY